MGCFNGFLCFDGTEAFNMRRDLTYLRAARHPMLRGPIDPACYCELLDNHDDGGNLTPWVSPAVDNVWWYDPAVPESVDLHGFMIESMKISVPFQREIKAKAWGATLPNPQYSKREVVITGWVFTSSSLATDYARNILLELFSGENCNPCTPPDLTYWASCPTDEDATDHIRTIRQCGLTGIDWAVEPDFPSAAGAKFILTISAEIPWITCAPVTSFIAPVLDGVPTCNLCNPCPSVAVVDFSCGCLTQPVRIVPEVDSFDCYHSPLTVTRTLHAIDPTPTWSNAVLNFEIFSGATHNPDGSGLRNMRIRGWANPLGLPVPPDGLDCQDPCIDFKISCLPASSTLTIDSLARSIKIIKDGASSRGARFLDSGGSNYWPVLDCSGMFLAIDADGAGTSADATVRVDVQRYERG